MEFQIYNIDRHAGTEALLYGKMVGNEKLPTSTIRVVNIVSNVLFLASPGHKDDLIAELSAFTQEITGIKEVSRHNIFFKSLERTLNLLQVSLRKPVSFEHFESDFCDFVHTEFSNPVENLIVSQGLRGTCLVRINMPDTTFDCTGRMVSGTKGAVPVINASDVSYLGPGELSNLSIVALDLETKNGSVVGFSAYDKTGLVRGVVEEHHRDSHFQNANDDLVGLDEANEPEINIFKNPQDLFEYLNNRIESYDVVVYHNQHNKHRLKLRGKIICDLFDFASGHLKGKDFSIAELAEVYGTQMDGTENKAVVLMRVFEAMNALGLAKELSEIGGCPLNKCLENSRLERIEYALLHELQAGNYLFPPVTQKKADKYTGGLVLDPIQGFYEDIVLLLDFNSLYPSIIQEFDVCFSTIGFEDEEENLHDVVEAGTAPVDEYAAKKHRSSENKALLFLPKILKKLVARRAEVKALLKSATNTDYKTVLDVKQKAIKLTANSIYGCLGSPASRFCNYQMASYITAKGRELLGVAKSTAESLGFRVIYGDTDSIMIRMNFQGNNTNVEKALESAKGIVAEINARYEHVEIEIEKVFKKLLLITKKKYAALVFDKGNDRIELKGLDTTRRDFCRASTELSRKVLEVMLEDAPEETTKKKAERVYDLCKDCAVSLTRYPIEMFVVYASFSKDPSLYNKAVPIPHVSLALRLRKGKGIVYKQNDVIPFVIGEGRGPLSDRAFHPDEKCTIDYSYYIKSQILPSLLRLVSFWPEVSRGKLELIFGLAESRQSRPADSRSLTFVTECCSTVHSPSRSCTKCGTEIPDRFYIDRVVKLLEEQCHQFYNTSAFCPLCELKYKNHLQTCFYCGKELLFNPPNQKFDDFLVSLESSFQSVKIKEISDLISLYSGLSAYRVIDFSQYFAEELKEYGLAGP